MLIRNSTGFPKVSEQRVANNKVVSLVYRISDDDGNVLEQVDMPVSYLHGGDGRLFQKIERALEGCEAGDSVTVSLTPEEGFGDRDPDLAFTDDIDNVPPQFRHVGAEVEMQNEAGDVRVFKVIKIEDGKLTVDCNHPLAGKLIIFTVQVVDVRDATAAEIAAGAPAQPNLH